MEGKGKENDTPLENQGERENAQQDKDESFKQMRTSVTAIAQEYICPITTDLPVDPVIAEDGRVYDREAIEKCMSTQGDEFRSPITNKRMGKKLLTAFHIRNTIQHLVESTGVDRELIERWIEKRREKMINETKKKASEDDIEAMQLLAAWYSEGEMGLPKSHEEAFCWYNKLAIKGDVSGLSMAGWRLTIGQGTAQNNIQGASFITSAAELGSETACLHLVNCYYHGKYGFPQDRSQVTCWVRKMSHGSCTADLLNSNEVKEFKDILNDLGISTDVTD